LHRLGLVRANLFLLQFPSLGLDFLAGGVLIAAAQLDDGLADAAQGVELGEGLFVQGRPLPGQDGAVAEGDGGGEEVGGELARRGVFEVLAVCGEFGGLGQEVLADAPFLEAAQAPVGEVLLRDGVAVEGLLEDTPDGREVVEPDEDMFAVLPVFEAGVEHRADCAGQPRDFTVASHDDDLLVMLFLFHPYRW
jgi:hypothetical protein